MNALWWLYAVVLGAALANLTVSLALQAKAHFVSDVRIHRPTFLWGLFLGLLAMQAWIASADYQATLVEVPTIDAVAFLWVPLSILVSSVFIGEQWWESSQADTPSSAAEQFPRVISPVLWVLVVMIIVNEVQRALRGDLAADINLYFPALLALIMGAGLIWRRWRDSTLLPVTVLLTMIGYVALGYSTVGASPAGV